MQVDEDIEPFVDEITYDGVCRHHPVINTFAGKQVHAVLRKLFLGQFFLVHESHGQQFLLEFGPDSPDVFLDRLEVFRIRSIVQDADLLCFEKTDGGMRYLTFTQIFPQLNATK